jgi:malonyl CoA-acyl carrier protein transacylase
MKTFVFPGQGSQSRGMGGDLFDEFPELTERANSILGYSIKELCLTDPRRELNKTRFTQPALYVVNALSYFKKIQDTGQKPDFVAGHSLGEFNALMAAECFDFEAGLKLVKKRGELMSQSTEGAMAAILNASKEQIEATLEKNGLKNIDLANFNTFSQIVISGSIDEIGEAQAFFQEGEVLYYPLNTSGAFHSRFMKPAKEKFENYLKKFKFSDLQIPVMSNVTAQPYKNEEILHNISNQISSAVQWADSVKYLIELAEEASDTMEFIEIGHGDVLTKLVTKIKSEVAGLSKSSAKKTATTHTHSQTLNLDSVIATANSPAGTPSITAGPSEKDNRQRELDTSDSKAASESPAPNAATDIFGKTEAKVASWNKTHPVGTKVKSTLFDYGDLVTRTEAVVLFGHRAAVYMKEYNGYFDLDEIIAV